MESEEFVSDFVSLSEGSLRRDGTISLKVIEPGWGSSGYYPEEVLKRDGPIAFKKGTKMFWDHPTITEESERPERSVRDLAAEFTSAARWDDSGPDGPGLYADAKVFGGFRDSVKELAPHIGVSILGSGVSKSGEAEGRTGAIIEKIVNARSVDFVTSPAAGGKILDLFEAARPVKEVKPREEEDVSIEALKEAHASEVADLKKKLREATEAIEKKDEEIEEKDVELTKSQKAEEDLRNKGSRALEALLINTIKAKVAQILKDSELPAITRDRLAESISKSFSLKEGQSELDDDAEKELKTAVKEAAKVELEYLVEATGGHRITGAGSGSGSDGHPEEIEKRMAESFARIGLSESAAKVAAKGR